MERESLNFLKDLLAECGPSGFEESTQATWTRRTKRYADEVRRDVHGNAIAVINEKAKFKVMLAGHCDEIGFIITHISDDGYLHIAPVGGIDPGVLPGSQVKIQSEKGLIDGVIGKKPIHLMEPDERTKSTPIIELWVDIGASDREDALKVINIGDPISYAPNFMMLRNRIFSSKGCDNRTGAFVASEVLKELSKSKKKTSVGVYAVSTVQEEVGLRGAITSAYGVNPDVGIAIDVGFASDTPGIDKRVVGEVYLGKGPILHAGPNINRKLGQLLVGTAKKKRIPYQFSSEPRATGTDANALQLAHGGCAAALVSIPNRYMHTMVESCSLDDLVSSAKLIAQTILSMNSKTDFIPG